MTSSHNNTFGWIFFFQLTFADEFLSETSARTRAERSADRNLRTASADVFWAAVLTPHAILRRSIRVLFQIGQKQELEQTRNIEIALGASLDVGTCDFVHGNASRLLGGHFPRVAKVKFVANQNNGDIGPLCNK